MGRIDDEIGTAVYGVAILCGGRSSRMGQDKAEMRIQAGGPRMVDRLLAAFSECDEILLSVRDEKQLADLGLMRDEKQLEDLNSTREGEQLANPDFVQDGKQRIDYSGVIRVTDTVSGAGPLAGIVASLRACRNGLLFVTAVDMPYMDRKFAEELLRAVEINKMDQAEELGQIQESKRAKSIEELDQRAAMEWEICPGEDGEKASADWDVIVPVDPDGRPHPLCAFYRKSALPVLEESLRDGTYSLWRVFQKLRVRRVPAETLEDSARKLMNLNRPEDVK